VLIESSPAAILTLDSSGNVLHANEAAHRLLSSANANIAGQPIRRYLPLLADALRTPATRFFRTSMQCRGQRENGAAFFAQVWFSTYQTETGPRLAAIVVDSSEDLRDREEHGLHQLLSNTRILVGAVSHEIRNFCAAIAVVHANLSRIPDVSLNPDFRALGSLVEGLGKIASAELHPMDDQALSQVDLATVMEEVRLIAAPSFEESGVGLDFHVPAALPAAWGDHHGVLQVFLNLAQNARRVLEHCDRRELAITTTLEGDRLVVRFKDTGPGIPSPERLFRPFQHGADVVGLGLYVSRAIVRSFKGELRHEPLSAGCCFAVELKTAASQMRD
jgi:signal transduction histidine kinase